MDSERVLRSSVPTGDPRVDAALRGLDTLENTDLADRPAVLEDVHDRLRAILGELGDPGRPAPAGPAAPGQPGRRGEQGELGGAFPLGTQPRPGAPDVGPGVPPPAGPRPGGATPGSWQRRPGA